MVSPVVVSLKTLATNLTNRNHLNSRLLNWLLALLFIGLGVSLFLFDSITIPSRGGARPHHIEGLGVFLVAALPLSFGAAILLGTTFPKSPKYIGTTILLLGFTSFFIGFLI